MIRSKESLKAKLRRLSMETEIEPYYILQSFMFEEFLQRLSRSTYKKNFIVKGGMLLSAVFGAEFRSTIDLDITLKGLPLTEEILVKMIGEIVCEEHNSSVLFEFLKTVEIREHNVYGGYRVTLKATLDNLWTYLNIDFTAGDVITYREIEYAYKTILGNDTINLLCYNYETIIAEKFETIVSRGTYNSRMKDYYDIHMFVNFLWKDIDRVQLKQAIINTSKNRGSLKNIDGCEEILKRIEEDSDIIKLWSKYKNRYVYAKTIDFSDVLNSIKKVSKVVK